MHNFCNMIRINNNFFVYIKIIFFLLAIVEKEVGEFAHCVTKRLQARQVDYAEVAWSLPIKAFSVHNQQLLIAQQIKRKLFVVVNVVSTWIELYKHVESLSLIHISEPTRPY